MKDESVHPTGTFKYRLAEAATSAYGPCTFGSITYGNTATAFAYALQSNDDQKFVAFLPRDFATWKLGPSTTGAMVDGSTLMRYIEARGVYVILLDLTKERYGDADLIAMLENEDLLALPFVNVTNGLARPTYSQIIQEALAGLPRFPDVCVVQYGAGVLANEAARILRQLSPRTRVVAITTPLRESISPMLYGPQSLDHTRLRHEGAVAIHDFDKDSKTMVFSYNVHWITEEELRAGLDIAQAQGLTCEPAGAAGFGILDRLPALLPGHDAASDTVLLINTGNGIDPLISSDPTP